jgi:glycosyltransferase involved in cell wall biosynthesis
MRILQVVHGSPERYKGGVQIYVYNLSKELTKNYDVHIFSPVVGKKYFLRNFKKNGLKIHEIEIPLNNPFEKIKQLKFESSYKNKKIDQIFEKLLERIKPDIIHFHHLVDLSVSLIEIAKSKNIPIVLTLHDYWFICPTFNLLKNGERCEGPEEDCGNCFICWNEKRIKKISKYFTKFYFLGKAFEAILDYVLRLINYKKKFKKRNGYMKVVLDKVDKIIAPSKFLKKVFVKHGISKSKIICSANGYNLNLFKNFKRKKNAKLVFGFAGGIIKHKGIDVLIEAFNKIDNENVELRIYGNYNPYTSEFRKIMLKVMNKNIKFMGRYEDVKKFFSQIDILIFPSLCYENCPLILLEANITKTPIIASKIGAISEFINNGRNGLLFEVDNTEDLYKKIMKIVNNQKLIKKFKKNMIHVKTIKEQASELKKIYRNLIRNKK